MQSDKSAINYFRERKTGRAEWEGDRIVQNCTLKLGMHVNLKTGKKQSTDRQYTVKLTP